jgi:predicted NBD/HSP70 family sugar kinase
MTLDPHGEVCSCGRRGCWETFASDRATIARYSAISKSHQPVQTVTDLISLAQSGDAAATTALEVTARYLGEGIANLAHGLSPEVVVVGGEITGAWQMIGPIIKEAVKSNYIVPPISFNIRPSSVQHPGLFGAIPIALQHCFRLDQNRESERAALPISLNSLTPTDRAQLPR